MIRFRRIVAGSPAQNEDIGNVAWIQERSILVHGSDGVDGTDGVRGSDGSDGTDGVRGSDGSDGTDGVRGSDGSDGTDGVRGPDGSDGTDGVRGSDGSDGARGAAGARGPQGIPGVDFDGPILNMVQALASVITSATRTFTGTQNSYTVDYITNLDMLVSPNGKILQFRRYIRRETTQFQGGGGE